MGKIENLRKMSETAKNETGKATLELLKKAETSPRKERKTPGRKKKPGSENYIPMTFRVEKGRLDKLRTLARIYGTTATEVLEQALDSAIRQYEEKNGEIIPDTGKEITIF